METYSYDAVGNPRAHTDFNGTTVLFAYDAMDRLVRRTYPGGVENTFTYTPTGQRATATDPRGTTTYAYSATGQLTRVTHPGGETIQYAYDADGNLGRFETGSATVDYAHDALNRIVSLAAVTNGAPLGTIQFGYDAAGNVLEQVRPNGVTTRMSYDLRNRVNAISHMAGATTLASFTYQLSPTGRRTQVNEAGGGIVRYGYDALDRLISEVRDGSLAAGYEYDAIGNRTRMNRNGATTTYAYDVDDRLLSAGSANYAYDGNGNLLSRTIGGVPPATSGVPTTGSYGQAEPEAARSSPTMRTATASPGAPAPTSPRSWWTPTTRQAYRRWSRNATGRAGCKRNTHMGPALSPPRVGRATRSISRTRSAARGC